MNIGWCVGRHEVDGAEHVYAAVNPNIVVVSIDYRLYVACFNIETAKLTWNRAPEHPFPQPINDCYDGLLWVYLPVKQPYLDFANTPSANKTPKPSASTQSAS